MKKSAIAVFGIALVLATAGCFKHTYKIGAGAPNGDIVSQNWQHHWVFGLVRPNGQKTIDVEKFCPSGNATVEQEMTFVNGLINALIGFIYSPRTVTIRCADGSRSQIELSADEVAQIVSDPQFLEIVSELVPERLAEAKSAFEYHYAVVDPPPTQGTGATGF